ncbi:uncharacterized protein LOC125229542 [Leguminivora glycinivorella]|uniref:uncharacterized protein LOC125229542 n=1 Tax=Leguminivora glycinivorella TaxID=1035111 RepID=UPI00200E4388|nr:uncharacterized protein LOC125229542 [Leguminivora glycinivorella]
MPFGYGTRLYNSVCNIRSAVGVLGAGGAEGGRSLLVARNCACTASHAASRAGRPPASQGSRTMYPCALPSRAIPSGIADSQSRAIYLPSLSLFHAESLVFLYLGLGGRPRRFLERFLERGGEGDARGALGRGGGSGAEASC